VYKSTDSGATWTSCAALSNANVRTLTLDNAGKLYAGTEAGVFVSADACASWAAMSAGLP
jgi:ligand-binding sensor domain-containing protein